METECRTRQKNVAGGTSKTMNIARKYRLAEIQAGMPLVWHHLSSGDGFGMPNLGNSPHALSYKCGYPLPVKYRQLANSMHNPGLYIYGTIQE